MAPLLSLIVVALSSALALADLGSDLSGAGITALFPGQDGYAAASQAFNQRFTFEPSAVSYPSTPEDVSTIVKLGAANNLQVVARGGGHSYIANGLGGKNGSLVVDLSHMKSISVDSSTNTAVIGSGNRLGDVALTLNNAGRALPHGTCPYVGIGGHSSFGGYGFTSRQWGLTLDTIFAINAVLANGTIVRATESSYPDLFWALRGAAPSFAISTSIEVNTFAAPSFAKVFQYTWQMDYSTAGKSLLSFQSFSLSGPASPFAAELVLSKGNERGSVTFGLTGAWYGEESALSSTLQPWLDVMPTPDTVVFSGNGTYIDSVQVLGGKDLSTVSTEPDSSDTFYAKSITTPETQPMTLEACTSFMEYLSNEGYDSDTNWFVEVELYGGPNSKIREIPNNATAFSRRDTLFTMQLYASSANGLPPYPDSGFTFLDGLVVSLTSKMPTNWNYGAYANYIDNRLANWEQLYFDSNYARLRSLKDELDPQDVFMFPTSVEE